MSNCVSLVNHLVEQILDDRVIFVCVIARADFDTYLIEGTSEQIQAIAYETMDLHPEEWSVV